MSKLPWFAWYPADFERKTGHLSNEVVGAYVRLMNHYWSNNGQINFDPADLCRIMRTERRRFNHIWRYLDTFFVLQSGYDGDTLLLPRLQEELEKAIEISKTKAASGRKGGLASAKAKKKHTPSHSTFHIIHKELGGGANVLEKTAPHVFVEKERKHDYSNWKPSDIIKDRIRLNCTGIDDKFIDGCVAEFVTYAETHYTPDQLDSRFIKSVTSDHKHTQLRGYKVNAKPAWASIPADDNELWNWANEHGFRAPGGTETYIQYRNQLKALVAKRLDKEQA